MALTSSFALAAHALALLAVSDGGAATSEVIASSATTHPARVRRVLAQLARAGIVVGREGAGGGYRLGRAAERITLAEVFDALDESPIFPLHPRDPNERCRVGRGITAALNAVDREAAAALRARLADHTVAWLARAALESAGVEG